MSKEIEEKEVTLMLTSFIAMVAAAKIVSKDELDIILPLFTRDMISGGVNPEIVNKLVDEMKGVILDLKVGLNE